MLPEENTVIIFVIQNAQERNVVFVAQKFAACSTLYITKEIGGHARQFMPACTKA